MVVTTIPALVLPTEVLMTPLSAPVTVVWKVRRPEYEWFESAPTKLAKKQPDPKIEPGLFDFLKCFALFDLAGSYSFIKRVVNGSNI